jgi:hypothetical protein
LFLIQLLVSLHHFSGIAFQGEAAMATEIHSHGLQHPTDNSVFGLGYADNADSPYAQDPLFDFGASTLVLTDASPAQTLYLTEAGTAAPVSVTDINQGQLGDCFLLAPVGEEALFHPSAIMNMIHDNGNGTEAVTLYVADTGSLPNFGTTSFKAVTVTVNNSFSAQSVDNGAYQDVVGNQKEIWPQVIEKAVATLDGGYNAIANGGYPVLAMEELTGQTASYMSPASLTLATLQSYVSAGDLITMDTSSNGLGYGLVGDHSYMFDKIVGSGSSASAQLLNPWGIDQPAAIPLTRLAQSGIVEVDIGHLA